MSDVKKGNVMEQLEKNGIDVTATLDNIIKKFPDLIVYAKNQAPANEKAPDENESNKEQEFHKPENNSKCYDKSDDPNKCCDCDKCEDGEKQEETEEDHPCGAAGCLLMGPMSPEIALMINILEGLSAINNNILEIVNQLHENAPKEIKEAAELKTCKMHTGVSKKQLVNLMDSQKRDIVDHIDEKINALVHQLFRGESILSVDPNLLKNKDEKKKK